MTRGWKIFTVLVLVLSGLMHGTAQADDVRVYPYVNHAGIGWGVRYGVEGWNANGRVIFVRVPSCDGIEGQCLEIWAAPLQADWLGQAAAYNTDRPQVTFNTLYRSLPWRFRRQAGCHELGHVLGLGHHADSCMEEYATGVHLTPSPADLAWVRAQYPVM